MNIFEVVPENFFSILVSKNKNVYIDALFVLKDVYEQEMKLPKDDVIARLMNRLEEELNQEDFSEEEGIEDLKDENISSKAYFLLRKLKATGWIEMEMQRDSFEEHIILPDYTIKFLEFLKSIVETEQTEYGSYVFATYSSLKVASENKRETYDAINTAYRNTEKLISELKSLYNSLGRFHRNMVQHDNINDIIHQHFFEYKEYSDEIIFPRFTRDSVPRYKTPIKEMLTNILTDSEWLDTTVQMAASTNKKYASKEDAETDILNKIRKVLENYEKVDDIMNQIEEKNTDYIRAFVHRMQYLLTSDKELKGKLVQILKNVQKQEVLEKMEETIHLCNQEYVAKDCIYMMYTNDRKKQGPPLPIKKEKAIDAKAFYEFAKSVEKLYSHQKIMGFMEKNFNGKPFITSSEICLQTTEDLILLILATIKGEKSGKSFYTIEDSLETIENNGYKIPNIKFIRRS